jgi:CheY-like chemotaxis protein
MEEALAVKLQALVVEDSADCAALLNHILIDSKLFGQIRNFMMGEDALQYLEDSLQNRTALPDIIFLDLQLPGEHGLRVLEKIKSEPALKPVPVVVMTASEDRQDWADSYRKGGTFFIRKPLDRELLVDTLLHMKITGVLKKKSS